MNTYYLDKGCALSTRDRIVDAAADVLRRQGLAHATTKQIAAAAGLSEAALYKHFPGKEALLVAVVHEHLPELVGTLKQLPELVGRHTVADNLTHVAGVAVPFYRELVPMAGALFAEPTLLARHQEGLREQGLGPHLAIAALAGYLAAEQRGGRIAATADPRAAAAALLGACVQRAFFTEFVGPHSVAEDEAAFATAIVGQVMRALAPEG